MQYNFFSFFKIAYRISPAFIIIGIITALVSGILTPITVLVNAKLIDMTIDVVKHQQIVSGFVVMLVVFLLLTLLKQVVWVPNYFIQGKFILRFREDFLGSILDKVAKLEYNEIENKETLDLIHRIKRDADNKIVTNFTNLMGLLENFVSIIGVFAILCKVGWWLAIIVVLILFFTIYLSYKCGNVKFRATFDFTETDRKVDYIDMLLRKREVAPETKLFRTIDHLKEVYLKNFDTSTKIFHKAEVRHRPASEVLMGVITNTFLLILYVIMLYPLLKESITIGFYLALVNASIGVMDFVSKQMPNSMIGLFEYRLYWNEVNKLFQLPERMHTLEKPKPYPGFKQIRFENVYFKYPNTSNYLLKGVSFTLDKNKHYAFIGENGAGKTTIIKLMTGLYKPTEGKITIDGRNIEDIPDNELAGIFSIVFQDFAKYFLSVKDNILLGTASEELDSEKIEKIIKEMSMDSFIENLSEGYDTFLGKIFENGTEISGGEWQKLILCRSLYANAPVRILDEPTASLDPDSESRLYRLYANIIERNNMTIFISHRLASTQLADEIILIEDGQVKERGSHLELMKAKGRYHDMFKMQKQWYERENELFQ